MRDPIEVAYLAGFFDGEGCIAINRVRSSLYLQVVQTRDREPLDRFHAMFGGRVFLSNRRTLSGRTVWTWQLHAEPMFTALEAMLPYLTVKRDEARIALQYKRYPKGTNRLSVEDREARLDIMEKLRTIRHRTTDKSETQIGPVVSTGDIGVN